MLEYFHTTERDWEGWEWHTRHIIRGVKTLSSLIRLTDEEYEAVKFARENRIPFGITPYYLSLMDYKPGREKDYHYLDGFSKLLFEKCCRGISTDGMTQEKFRFK